MIDPEDEQVLGADELRFWFSFRSRYGRLAAEGLSEGFDGLPVQFALTATFSAAEIFPNDPSPCERRRAACPGTLHYGQLSATNRLRRTGPCFSRHCFKYSGPARTGIQCREHSEHDLCVDATLQTRRCWPIALSAPDSTQRRSPMPPTIRVCRNRCAEIFIVLLNRMVFFGVPDRIYRGGFSGPANGCDLLAWQFNR
jgi:hypothetical protein